MRRWSVWPHSAALHPHTLGPHLLLSVSFPTDMWWAGTLGSLVNRTWIFEYKWFWLSPILLTSQESLGLWIQYVYWILGWYWCLSRGEKLKLRRLPEVAGKEARYSGLCKCYSPWWYCSQPSGATRSLVSSSWVILIFHLDLTNPPTSTLIVATSSSSPWAGI